MPAYTVLVSSPMTVPSSVMSCGVAKSLGFLGKIGIVVPFTNKPYEPLALVDVWPGEVGICMSTYPLLVIFWGTIFCPRSITAYRVCGNDEEGEEEPPVFLALTR